ncbi:ras-related protein Rab-3D [Spatholobus suberectus]|nr:ras-related protein Rab-3D [Spatholobus suberectus]
MMMNVLGLSLVVTSLAAAGIFSPSADQTQQKQGASTIVKEGHRVVVVEYDQGGHQNTKISISPEQPQHDHDDNHIDNAKHKIKEAASVLPNLGQSISQHPEDAPTFLHAPKELIGDAYGKCKHKIADAMEKTKDKAQEALHSQVGDTVADALRNTKQTVYDKARDVQETAETAKDHIVANVSEARDTLRHVKHALFKRLESMESLNSLMGVANLLGFATAYGMCVWVTFISSYVQSRAMPRQQFAVVQSKIYPVYFRAMAYSIGVALLGHVLAHTLQLYNLLASLVTVFVNSVYLEPRATKLMFERIKIEKEEGRGREDLSGEHSRTGEHQRATDPKEPSTTADQDAVRSRIIKLNDKLKKLNSYSSLLNILNLMSLTWHLVYLAQRLHHTC